jgi:hypothetical protein
MAIQNASDAQKVDYLWKKIAYGATKTDISGNIDATQEPFPSPLQIRSDKILRNSEEIPTIIPTSNTSIVTVYTTSLPIECVRNNGIATPTLTWLTEQNFWIPPEFGPTYQVKVYIAPSGNAANVASKGTQVFATGSGNNDLWVFDYQSGILNFNSNNTPYNGASPISFTGNSVYISGAVYSGEFGLPSAAELGNVLLGNIRFNDTTITTATNNADIYLTAQGTGVVQITGTGAVGIPAGDTGNRPTEPTTGYIRYNTDDGELEYWTGTGWTSPGTSTITSDVIAPDGASNVYPLSSNATTTGVMVSINGTLQQPTTAYTIVNNNQIQFTEIPVESDVIEVRHIVVGGSSISSSKLQVGDTSVSLDLANVIVAGNLLPITSTVYDLGNANRRWRGVYAANISISTQLTISGSQVNTNANITVTANTSATIDSYDKTLYRTAKYLIQSTSSNHAESYDALVIHNGATTANVVVYNSVNTGSSLGNLNATISGNTVNLTYTAYSSATNVRISKNYIII